MLMFYAGFVNNVFFQQRENIHRCKIKYVKYPREICFLFLAAALLEETKETNKTPTISKPMLVRNKGYLQAKIQLSGYFHGS